MQTFIVGSFGYTASVLDKLRLNKEVTETKQIHNTICGFSKGWSNHPIVKAWASFPEALWMYGLAMEEEALERGINISPYFSSKIYENYQSPPWFFDSRFEKFVSGCKSRLLFKGRVDATAYAVRSYLKVRSINDWFSKNGYPQKNVFKYPDILRLEQFCVDNNIKIGDNHYRQFGWTEDDSKGYFWPV